ncbi:uncharacterized protein LOC111742743 [Pteropus vampyrus]|uniref:Uncharacterized protein LOC111742743 n=1 Tax=Pteropus vampyrus TaxID=132908 RepID=A0A6P6CNT1_PTEVA|nr:uncharacterized protein LOC111742743 [Pteropus vampyrus]
MLACAPARRPPVRLSPACTRLKACWLPMCHTLHRAGVTRVFSLGNYSHLRDNKLSSALRFELKKNENSNVTPARGYSWKQSHTMSTCPPSAHLLRHCGHRGWAPPVLREPVHSRPQCQGSIPKGSLSEASTGLHLPRRILRPSREQRDSSDLADMRAPPLPGHVALGKKEAQPIWAPTCSSVNGGDDLGLPFEGLGCEKRLSEPPENLSSDTFSVLCPPLHEIPIQTRTFFLWTPSLLGSLRKGHWKKGRAGQPCVPTAGTLKARWVLPTAWGGGHGKSECFHRTAQKLTVLSWAPGRAGTMAVVKAWGEP